jgi:hypothetical protein
VTRHKTRHCAKSAERAQGSRDRDAKTGAPGCWGWLSLLPVLARDIGRVSLCATCGPTKSGMAPWTRRLSPARRSRRPPPCPRAWRQAVLPQRRPRFDDSARAWLCTTRRRGVAHLRRCSTDIRRAGPQSSLPGRRPHERRTTAAKSDPHLQAGRTGPSAIRVPRGSGGPASPHCRRGAGFPRPAGRARGRPPGPGPSRRARPSRTTTAAGRGACFEPGRGHSECQAHARRERHSTPSGLRGRPLRSAS